MPNVMSSMLGPMHSDQGQPLMRSATSTVLTTIMTTATSTVLTTLITQHFMQISISMVSLGPT